MSVGANKPIRGQILFVDDDAFYRDLAGTALGEAGFQVHIANDGQQAVAAVTRQPFDLIVLDLAMPGMSGFDVLETIRTTLMKTDVPVLVITGNDDTQSVERAFDFGAT